MTGGAPPAARESQGRGSRTARSNERPEAGTRLRPGRGVVRPGRSGGLTHVFAILVVGERNGQEPPPSTPLTVPPTVPPGHSGSKRLHGVLDGSAVGGGVVCGGVMVGGAVVGWAVVGLGAAVVGWGPGVVTVGFGPGVGPGTSAPAWMTVTVSVARTMTMSTAM